MRQINLREYESSEPVALAIDERDRLAEPSVGDSVCRRSARIGNCETWPDPLLDDDQPDGTYGRPEPYSCVPGTQPIDHSTLTSHEGG